MINQALTQAFKDTIKKLDLIKSGRLYREAVLDVTVLQKADKVSIIVNASAPDYLEFLVNKHPIIETWQEMPAVSEELGKSLEPVIQSSIQTYLEDPSKPLKAIEPEILFTVNGV